MSNDEKMFTTTKDKDSITLRFVCICGETTTFVLKDKTLEIAKNNIKASKSKMTTIKIRHGDHDVLLHVDNNFKTRYVQNVLDATLVEDITEFSAQVSLLNELSEITSQFNPFTMLEQLYFSMKLKYGDDPRIFSELGSVVGQEVWLKLKHRIVSMGAKLEFDSKLLLINEISPILKKLIGDIDINKNAGKISIKMIKYSPEFISGLIDGMVIAMIKSNVLDKVISLEYKFNVETNTLEIMAK